MPVRFRVPALLLLGLLLLLPCPSALEAGPTDEPQVLRYNENGSPLLDPARYAANRMNDERLLIAVLEPLTSLDPETGTARPGAATSWSQGEDGVTWTFKLRPTATWSDGSPVTSADFVRSWKRTLDRSKVAEQASPWVELLFVLDGCREMIANAARVELFSELRKALDEEIERNTATGIPGDRLNDLLTDLGVRPYLVGVKGRAIVRLANWDSKQSFPAEAVKNVGEALKEARRDAKNAANEALDKFGKKGSPVYAQDAHTLVLRTEGVVPYLPDLVARGVFAPVHERFESIRDKMFEDAHLFISSGPFHFEGRGPRPPFNTPNEPTASLVHLMRSTTYDGPNKAKTKEIACLTEQWANESALKREDLRMFNNGTTDHVFCTWQELPPTSKKKDQDILGQYEAAKGFMARPSGTVVYLVFRCDRPPFDKKQAREAFARLVDPAAVAKVFWPGAEPLDRLVPPGIAGRQPGVAAPAPDVTAAKKAFKDSGFDLEKWYTVSYPFYPRIDTVAGGLLKSWEKAFGAEGGERMEANEGEMLKALRGGSYELMLMLVRGGADDPAAYLSRFHSMNPENGTGWRDAELDKLLDGARDPKGEPAKRLQMLAQAEKRLLDEYVVLPLAVLREAELGGKVKGWGSEAAWRKPGFVGALWAATK